MGIGSFKSYFGLWFYNGVFLREKADKLISAQEGKTKALRQWRLNSLEEIDEELILQYLEEAIGNQKQGRDLKPTRSSKFSIPDELAEIFDEDQTLKQAFAKFTNYKQREFAEYISSAKRENTKHKRIEKIVPMILDSMTNTKDCSNFVQFFAMFSNTEHYLILSIVSTDHVSLLIKRHFVVQQA